MSCPGFARVVVIVAIVLCGACAPTHNIKPLPNFVQVGIDVGDRITVVTRDGEPHKLVVREVSNDRLITDKGEFLLHDLRSIQKRAWRRPPSPCGGDEPLGCSVPWLVALTSDAHSHYQSVFYDACAQHDYCYRHGFATYGLDRKTCDASFLQDMEQLCPAPPRGIISRLEKLLEESVESRAVCLRVAKDYHWAVERFGAERFLTATSSYCEYNGPPSSATPAPPKPQAR